MFVGYTVQGTIVNTWVVGIVHEMEFTDSEAQQSLRLLVVQMLVT
jgi:hypothetical protein